jgi:hypothetical protein
MKKIFIILILSSLIACSGNESAEIKPTDLDRTDNDDTSARPILPDSVQQKTLDSTINPKQ